jgi:hypothetical protein
VNPPNLAQVKELDVGILRVGNGGGTSPILPSDSVEVWVDDIRLTNVINTPGYAGQAAMNIALGDVASIRFNATRRDPYFRQLAEQPSFLTSTGFDFAGSFRLDRLIPGASGLSLPLTVSHSEGASDPLFLSQTDILGSGITGLRTPRSDITRYSLTARRVKPITGNAWGVLLNNIQGIANYSQATSRSEFSQGGAATWDVGADYNLLANARYSLLPQWLDPRRDAPQPHIRWNPTAIRFSTDLGQTTDQRQSFLNPNFVPGDTGTHVTSLTYIWRNTAGVEFRPWEALTGTWNFSSVRDLRRYGDTSSTAIVATNERERGLGIDLGVERERTMNASVRFSPPVATWLHPSLSLESAYSMLRDPQSAQLVRTEDSTGAFRLPRRLNNLQTAGVGTTFDPARLFRLWLGDVSRASKVASMFQQFDVRYTRTLNSAYDGAPFTPGPAYQLGLGGLNSFLQTNDLAASSAASSDALTVSTGLRLPKDVELIATVQDANTRNYSRRLDNTQALIQGHQQTFPSFNLHWTDSVAALRKYVTRFTVNAGVDFTQNATSSPGEAPDEPGDHRFTRILTYPKFSSTIIWTDKGSLVTTLGYAAMHRVDSLPGSITNTNTQEFTGNASRSFRLPPGWGVPYPIQSALSWDYATSASFVSVTASTKPSRLSDNGRSAISLSANTPLAPNLKFTLSGSRVITFDNNLDTKFSQYVLTIVFTLEYFAGDIR